jgi:hypothetical protein
MQHANGCGGERRGHCYFGASSRLHVAHERASQFVGWWGLALLIQAAGVALAAASSPANANELLAIGTASLILGDAVKWKPSREFAREVLVILRRPARRRLRADCHI